MANKYSKRLERYFDDILEEKDDLFNNVGKLVNTANNQVQIVLKSEASVCEKEALLSYLTKILALFSQVNCSLLKFLETTIAPSTVESKAIITDGTYIDKSQSHELQDYLKEEQMQLGSDIEFGTEGPKIPNSEIQNDLYVRKPLDNTTLKAICTNLINTTNPPKIDEKKDVTKQDSNEFIILNPLVSPPLSYCSESDVLSTNSLSTTQHPLIKLCSATEIPEQYNSKELEKVKENMRYFSKKMGFDTKSFVQLTSEFNKSSHMDHYEQSSEDFTESILKNSDDIVAGSSNDTVTFSINDSDPHKLNEPSNNLSSPNMQDGPSSSTGAIRKQNTSTTNLDSCTLDSETSIRVQSWLTHNTPPEEESDLDRNHMKITQDTAAHKLKQVKRYDRNEEAREKAIATMPDLTLVPVKVPQVIKNDLYSDNSLSEKAAKKSLINKNKVKDFNKNADMHIITRELPDVGSICVFSHIVSPSEFYLQIVNEIYAEYLDKVSVYLENTFRKTESKFITKNQAFNKLGKFCYGYIEDKKAWFRLQVLDWKLGCKSDDVDVQAVDYGFKSTTMYSYLRELTVDLAHIPMLAVRCHFPLLYPPGSVFSNRLTEWPSNTIEALCDIANSSQDLNYVPENMFEIIFAMEMGDSLAVDLVPHLESQADSLGKQFIDMGLAVEIDDEFEGNPELGEFLADIDELERANNLNEFILGYDARDEARICRFTRKDGTCFKGKHCKLEHIQLKDGYTTDKTAVFFTAINDLILPSKGDTVQVLLTSYVDACTYLVQFIRNPVKKPNCNLVMDKDISDLMDVMNHPKIVAKYTCFQILPALGEVVLAFYHVANKWIRVAVRELNKNDDPSTIGVYAVDFGDEFAVNVKNIRVMNEEFMHVPFQVIQIYLDNFQNKKGCNELKARRFFLKHMAYRNFLAHIKSNEPPYKVSLKTFKNREIGATLVKEGFAEERSSDVFITEDTNKRGNLDLE